MENNLSQNIVFSKNVVEFVAVGVQYCSFLETFEEQTSSELSNKLTKLLPLLYLKATLLPEVEIEYDIYPEVSVTEDDYEYIVNRLYSTFKSNDTYLEVFLEDMKYSDTPISASISEDLADIYQDIKNFAAVYEQGLEESMYEALCSCSENFRLYWGQKLVNVLRALHSIRYSMNPEQEEDDSLPENMQAEW
ncbi:DUF5063 domain-containing protein [Dysgonomonas macrotermitis]|uniref:DUF5063 domain-containing protein n=1 Tax=Dysgonomonas macrotermitis TaxID=1346286 RepID=A0A1M5ELM6_9BACT|nr:DUF5063 domain-containing protein [Dysgonomonas macrotermitis]SHF80107.1 protein of unknown function [Dysgonomonas macrotermitis]